MTATRPLGPLEHVVVLMFENRSFDNVFGALHPHGPGFDGVPPSWSNPLDPDDPHSERLEAWSAPPGEDAATMPFPDPNELFVDMAEQIRHGSMQGFVANYAKALKAHGADPSLVRNIMQYYPAGGGDMSTSAALGRAYTVSDRYFGSGPVQTWANRFFAHCATAGHHKRHGKTLAYLDNDDYPDYHDPLFGQLGFKSIYEHLHAAGHSWRVYYDGSAPLTALLRYVYERWHWVTSGGHVWPLQADDAGDEDFFSDVAAGRLPTYSFLEPRYQVLSGEIFTPPSSNHPGSAFEWGGLPPIDVSYGEALLHKVFKALVANPPLFMKTLLIVTYDEHGGLFDHVPPPAAVSPYDHPQQFTDFAYTSYGPRVPALFINPYVRAVPAFRPPNGKAFDHTSILATLRDQFGLDGSLTRRDAAAPTFEGLIDTSREPVLDVDLPEITPRFAPEAYVPADGHVPPMPPDSRHDIGAVVRQLAARHAAERPCA